MNDFPYVAGALALALCVLSPDADAWGLGTHVYFAESLVTLPVAVPILVAAMQRFPVWVMAGACLPDLVLFGKNCGTGAFAANHQWETAHRLLRSAQSDEERAAAIGYCSHLFVDVIAHNHFVPIHERRWPNVPRLTHAAAEWAMDVHLGERIRVWPAEVLRAERKLLTDYVSDNFSCPRNTAGRTLRALTRAETLLRAVRLPNVCYHLALTLDRGSAERFDQYLAATSASLPQIAQVLAGAEPDWHPKGADRDIPALHDFAMLVDTAA